MIAVAGAGAAAIATGADAGNCIRLICAGDRHAVAGMRACTTGRFSSFTGVAAGAYRGRAANDGHYPDQQNGDTAAAQQ
ncbi:MAG: hypothetical protein HYR49_04375 [Gammaproteobacteria bacterium]|nr:hypothetical protein [Gammaproteobacteria bacterium]